MVRKTIGRAAATVGVLSLVITPAFAYSGERLAKQAKITMASATQIALKARPGTVTDRELEHEGGGSGLRYSFDIKSAGTAYEVGIDARDGRILENSREGANPD
jgi:uncharacterized membrane protein YkoI